MHRDHIIQAKSSLDRRWNLIYFCILPSSFRIRRNFGPARPLLFQHFTDIFLQTTKSISRKFLRCSSTHSSYTYSRSCWACPLESSLSPLNFDHPSFLNSDRSSFSANSAFFTNFSPSHVHTFPSHVHALCGLASATDRHRLESGICSRWYFSACPKFVADFFK